jgi:TonB-dependent SusC/RagA subfamily outer membrane receptor
VRLRGTNSFISGSDPLYIVDGVIIDNGSAQLADLGIRSNPQNRLADINPADIERIEVIRGAAAAALYGSRANNGVVQIFTKRGHHREAKVHAELALCPERAARAAAVQPVPVQRERAARVPVQLSGRHLPHRLDAGPQPDDRGRNDQTRYYISGNYSDEDGIMKTTSSKRVGGRANLQQQLASKLIGAVTANYITTENQMQAFGEQNDYGIMGSLFFAPTSVDFRPGERRVPAAAIARYESVAGDRSHS